MLLSTILQKILIFLCSCFSSVVPKLQYICKSLSHFPEHTPWLYESIYQFIVSSAAFYEGNASSITQTASSNQLYFSIWECFRKPSVNLSGFLSFPPSPDKSENTKALLPVVHFIIYPGGCAAQAASCDKCPCHLFKWQQSRGWWHFAVWQGVHKSVSSITTKSMNIILFQYRIYTWMLFPKSFWTTVVFEEFDNREFAFYWGQNNIFLFSIHKPWDTKEKRCWLPVFEVK